MGAQKENYEKTLPVTGKAEFKRELDFFLLMKEKSQKINQTKPKNNGK